jgi:hypothetical protein
MKFTLLLFIHVIKFCISQDQYADISDSENFNSRLGGSTRIPVPFNYGGINYANFRLVRNGDMVYEYNHPCGWSQGVSDYFSGVQFFIISGNDGGEVSVEDFPTITCNKVDSDHNIIFWGGPNCLMRFALIHFKFGVVKEDTKEIQFFFSSLLLL